MGTNWQYELKKYLARKFQEVTGEEISINNIRTVEVHVDINLKGLTISELGHIYAFAIMKEDFEHADGLANELASRGHCIKIDTDEAKKCGNINIINTVDNKVAYSVPMIVCADGMMIDFEKQGDF
jgi:hypothetical protein